MNKKLIIILVAVNLLTGAGILTYVQVSKPRTCYIDLQKVYAEFELKKELEQKLEAMAYASSGYLDSLEMKANVIGGRIEGGETDANLEVEYNAVAQLYASKSQEFDEQKQRVAAEYDEQIWGQLNEYVKQYGKEHNCDLIVAGNGDGSIMYARESKDITDKMIQYVNGKYQGQ